MSIWPEADEFLKKLVPCIIDPPDFTKNPKFSTVNCPSCQASVGQVCKSSTGKDTRYHQIRRQIAHMKRSDDARLKWKQRAQAGEVEFCKCMVCTGSVWMIDAK